MGSALTKNYDVEKEPYISGGQFGLWKVFRARKKFSATPDNADVSIFMLDKKLVTKKNTDPKKQQELFDVLKRDAQNLAKFRHPSMLNLIEAPIEDKSLIAFVTEPVEYTLANLENDASKKDLIPSDVDLKCIVLELMECVNFLHSNTKSIHMNISPEHLYVTKSGKLKLAGLNFITSITSPDPIPC
jgi:SCY1-like protein 2